MLKNKKRDSICLRNPYKKKNTSLLKWPLNSNSLIYMKTIVVLCYTLEPVKNIMQANELSHTDTVQ